MIKDSLIVEDIRRIRSALSEQFDHDVDKYIDYLQSKRSDQADIVRTSPRIVTQYNGGQLPGGLANRC